MLISKKYNNSVQFFFLGYLSRIVPKLIRQSWVKNHEIGIKTSATSVKFLLTVLKKKVTTQFSQLVDIAVVDQPFEKLRFKITYLLLSLQFNCRLYVTIKTDEVKPILSVTSVYKSAGWLEREVWDMYGVFVQKHPDLRRILTDYGFFGHPLRKDFPLFGFKEVFFNEEIKRIVYYPVDIDQNFRSFSFKNPWINPN